MEGNPSLQEIWERIQKEVCPPSVPVDIVLSNKISEKIIQKYFYKILRKGDYFTLSDAKNIVKSYDFRREKEERIIYALEQVNECHGIANAKAKELCKNKFTFSSPFIRLDHIVPVSEFVTWKQLNFGQFLVCDLALQLIFVCINLAFDFQPFSSRCI